jgi:hypothetical protein
MVARQIGYHRTRRALRLDRQMGADMETPFLATGAAVIDGATPGNTLITATEPETTDDERFDAEFSSDRVGFEVPFLAASASAIEGDVRGQTIITRQAPETTDDPAIG